MGYLERFLIIFVMIHFFLVYIYDFKCVYILKKMAYKCHKLTLKKTDNNFKAMLKCMFQEYVWRKINNMVIVKHSLMSPQSMDNRFMHLSHNHNYIRCPSQIPNVLPPPL